MLWAPYFRRLEQLAAVSFKDVTDYPKEATAC